MMKTNPTSDHLSAEQRVLVEQVSHSPGADAMVRRRAEALLLLDEGAPVAAVSRQVAMNRRSVRSLQFRHRLGGVHAALLGLRASFERRLWLALNPMQPFAVHTLTPRLP